MSEELSDNQKSTDEERRTLTLLRAGRSTDSEGGEPLVFSFVSKERTYDETECPHTVVRVDGKLWLVKCEKCGEQVDPIQFLVDLANEERSHTYRVNDLVKEEEKVKGKMRCKCEHCGKITRIVR